jgi:hypothetical protein
VHFLMFHDSKQCVTKALGEGPGAIPAMQAILTTISQT